MMLSKQRVVWTEGMLMEPQHFQQQERYFEALIDDRVQSVNALFWGFTHLELDQGLLEQGKIVIKSAKGVFPDGTPFHMPYTHPLPLPFEPGDNCQGKMICLSVMMDISGNPHIDLTDHQVGSRFVAVDADIPDRNMGITAEGTPQLITLQLGQLQSRLTFQSAVNSAESALPICFIQERTKNGHILLGDNFLPPMLDFRAIGWIESMTNELLGIVSQRLESMYRPDVQMSLGGLTELFELLLLQTLSEYKVKLSHLVHLPHVHPERLFYILLEMLGRLSFIPGGEQFWKRDDLHYTHEQPHSGYLPLFAALRRALSLVIEAPAIALSFVDQGNGIYVCQNDKQLRIEKLVFAVSADMPSDKLRINFPAQTKLGPVDKIAKLIDLQLPGARLIPLVTPPRHIPYYPNSIYFEVDTTSDIYQEMMSDVAMVLSVVGQFSKLRFDVWGLRESRAK